MYRSSSICCDMPGRKQQFHDELLSNMNTTINVSLCIIYSCYLLQCGHGFTVNNSASMSGSSAASKIYSSKDHYRSNVEAYEVSMKFSTDLEESKQIIDPEYFYYQVSYLNGRCKTHLLSMKKCEATNEKIPNQDYVMPKMYESTIQPVEISSANYVKTTIDHCVVNVFSMLILVIFALVLSIFYWKNQSDSRYNAMRTKLQIFTEPSKAVDHLHGILDAIGVGVISTDTRMTITFMNSAAGEMCGWTPRHALGRPVTEVVRLVDRYTSGCRQLREFERYVIPEDGTLMLHSCGGRRLDVRRSVQPLTVRGEVFGVVILLQDMTSLRDLIKKLSYTAAHDALTGLPNRDIFEQRLRSAVHDCAEFDLQHALVILDLDGFKAVNDSCGHAAGDALLQQIARLMQCQLRSGDFLARLGGDEFGIILFDCPQKQASALVNVLVRKVNHYVFRWKGECKRIGASAGVTRVQGGATLDELLARADGACYTAKHRGKGQVCVYEQQT